MEENYEVAQLDEQEIHQLKAFEKEFGYTLVAYTQTEEETEDEVQ